MKQICNLVIEPEEIQTTSSDQDYHRVLKVRLDKWLWATRFFKTRALARSAIEHGKILYNNENVSPNTEIQVNAIINIHNGRFKKVIIVKGLSTRRKNSTEAQELFEEIKQDEYCAEKTELSSSEYANKKERKVIRFLRRSLTRNSK